MHCFSNSQQERHDAYARLFDADAPLPPPVVKAHPAGVGGVGSAKKLVGALASLKGVTAGKAALVIGAGGDNEQEEEEEHTNEEGEWG